MGILLSAVTSAMRMKELIFKVILIIILFGVVILIKKYKENIKNKKIQEKIVCTKCGNSLSATAMYCNKCGYKLESAERYGKKRVITSKEKKKAIVCCCICLPILVYFGLFHIPKTDWDWEMSASGRLARINRYNGSENEVVIPNTVKKGWIPYRVDQIDDEVFYKSSSLTSIVIPNDTVEIGNRAFYECTSLTHVETADGIKKPGEFRSGYGIGEEVFYGCSSLTSVVLPELAIGNRAFYGCSSLVSIEGCNHGIGEEAFYGCSSLTSIVIPDGVVSIGNRAFYGCNSLTNVEIPSDVNLGEDVFPEGCKVKRR